jgi:hypothetical protein
MGGTCCTHEGLKNAYRSLVRKSVRKRPLRNLDVDEDDIKMDLKEIGWEGVNCSFLVQNRNK